MNKVVGRKEYRHRATRFTACYCRECRANGENSRSKCYNCGKYLIK